jgi:penicillin-binding protein 2
MSQRSQLRFLVVQVLVLSMFVALLGRLFYLQIAAGPVYQLAAEDNQSRDIVTGSIRGLILDDQGRPLAANDVALVVTADHTTLSKLEDKGEKSLRRLSALIDIPYEDLWSKTRLCGTTEANRDFEARMAAYERAVASGKKGVKEPRRLCWNGSSYQPIPLSTSVGAEMALRIVERNDLFVGIDASPQGFRNYPGPSGALLPHVLGYTGIISESELAGARERGEQVYLNQIVGKAGLERQYDEQLRGSPGIKTVIVDRNGRVVRTLRETAAGSGNHVATSINAEIQAATEKALEETVIRARTVGDSKGRRYADGGAAIVMDLRNGRIVAMASYPTYDPNIWRDGITDKQARALFSAENNVPALSRAIQGQYAPASTFKVVSIGAAAAAGYNLDASYNCPSNVKVGNRTFSNFESRGLGVISMNRAIAVSCDTVWYQIAYDMWIRDGGNRPKSNAKDYFFSMARDYGLGKKTGIDLPSESSGRVPDRTWKKSWWDSTKDFYCNYEKRAKPEQRTPLLLAIAKENCVDGYRVRAGDAVNFSIGQGDTTATLLQMVQIYGAIANGGTMYRPTIARAFLSPDGKVIRQIEPEVTRKLTLNKKTLAFLQRSLRSVVTEGTAAGTFATFPLPISGKTGTGEVYGRNPNGSLKDDTSWFISYGPTDKPIYAVGMVVSQGGYGGTASGAGTRKIWDAIYAVKDGKVRPDRMPQPDGPPQRVAPINVSTP